MNEMTGPLIFGAALLAAATTPQKHTAVLTATMSQKTLKMRMERAHLCATAAGLSPVRSPLSVVITYRRSHALAGSCQ